MRPVLAARLFGALVLLVAAFQLALAAGAPWGALAMGGQFPGRLPAAARAAAVVQAAMLLLFGAIVAARAGLALARWRRASRKLVWVVVAYTVVGVVLNAITPSPKERALWLPVTLVLCACAVAVARERRG
jgi:hypothetical protein